MKCFLCTNVSGYAVAYVFTDSQKVALILGALINVTVDDHEQDDKPDGILVQSCSVLNNKENAFICDQLIDCKVINLLDLNLADKDELIKQGLLKIVNNCYEFRAKDLIEDLS